MSLRAVVEIMVHLESFRNIDLFFQGIYYTRLKVYYKKKQDHGSSQPTLNGKREAKGQAQTQAA